MLSYKTFARAVSMEAMSALARLSYASLSASYARPFSMPCDPSAARSALPRANAAEGHLATELDLLSHVANWIPRPKCSNRLIRIASYASVQPREIFAIFIADPKLCATLLPSAWVKIAKLTLATEKARLTFVAYAQHLKRLIGHREVMRVLLPYRLLARNFAAKKGALAPI